jgi:nucleoid DNA-binding protein
MFDSLYRYLIKYKQVSLPGMGTLSVQIRPARSEFVDRSFFPSQYSFVFEPGKEISSRELFSWLAHVFITTEREAVIRLNDFFFGIKKELEAGNEITWNGVGKFQKTATGEIRFEAAEKELSFQRAVIAEKVIHENMGHTMRVGEMEKTSIEMSEMLSGTAAVEVKRSYWWIWPLAIIVVIVMFLGWYFSEHGINPGSSGNNKKISPAEAPAAF